MYFRVFASNEIQETEENLRVVLGAFPHALEVVDIESHPRGGLALQVEGEQTHMLSLCEFLYDHDWRVAI